MVRDFSKDEDYKSKVGEAQFEDYKMKGMKISQLFPYNIRCGECGQQSAEELWKMEWEEKKCVVTCPLCKKETRLPTCDL